MRLPFRVLTALAASTLATGALLLSVATAHSETVDEPPVSGDDRATAFPGNIKMDDCAAANLAGSAIDVESTDDGTFITITSVPEGVTLTGVVVKGGAAYNVYVGDVRDDLHAPLNPNGSPAGISHWFACGTEAGTTSTTTTTSDTSSSETTTSEASDTSDTSSGATDPGTGDTDVSSGGLADTGFSARVPLIVAGLLILLGAGLLTATRRLAFRRN